ncbi:MAG TPA: hypothetical protein VGB64_03675 [Actinomycetota bacterium]
MKRIIGLLLAVLGLSLGVGAAQPAAACEAGQVARVEVTSEALAEVHPVFSGVSVEVWASEDNDAPVSVSAMGWDGASGLVCSDLFVEEVKDTVGL